MMNKGLEVIEAHWLFNMPYNKIKVIIHPESLIHSLVSYADGSFLAHLGARDMRIPIQYALTWPERRGNDLRPLDLEAIDALHFAKPDLVNFPCLKLAYAAGEKGGAWAAALNGANEELVEAYLRGMISFGDIARCNEKIMERYEDFSGAALEPYYAADKWARDVLRRDYLKIRAF
jgi:1-deoxy-D-xylulose-5-phosphate reductoisomerase